MFDYFRFESPLERHWPPRRALNVRRLDYVWPKISTSLYGIVRRCEDFPECEPNLNMNVSYSCFSHVAHSNFLKWIFLAHHRESSDASTLWLLLLTCPVNWRVPLRNQTVVDQRHPNISQKLVYPLRTTRYYDIWQWTTFFQEILYFFMSALGHKNIKTMAYHLQTNGQVERHNWSIKFCLQLYGDDNQWEWDIFVQPFLYAYSFQAHISAN